MLWQYLAEVDLLQGESDDEEVVASFAVQFFPCRTEISNGNCNRFVLGEIKKGRSLE